MYQPQITLRVLSGHFVEDTDLFKMDPYCKVLIGGKEFKTKVHHSAGKNPVWGDSFAIPPGTDGTVHLSVWDKDTFSADDFIAETTLNVFALAQSGQLQVNQPVFKKGKLRGNIQLQIIR